MHDGFGPVRALAPALALIATLAAATERAPSAAVSPGAPGRAVEIEARCPTFSWAVTPGARGSELVVLRLPAAEGGEAQAEPIPVLRKAFSEGVTGWTPALDDCLERGASYAWTVRALESDSQAAATDWSTPLLFRVSPLPSLAEVEQALEVLRAHREAAGGDSTRAASPPFPSLEASSSGRRIAPERPRSGHSPEGAPVTAIRGETSSTVDGSAGVVGHASGASGDLVGVAGRTDSPSGSGVLAANLDPAGGTDLLLDGGAQGETDAKLTESGLDRPSIAQQTFGFGNSGGGGFVLDVDGTVDASFFVGDGSGLGNVTPAPHVHAGADITSGTVAEPRIDGALARDAEVFGLVLASDGSGSTLDADRLDGLEASELIAAATSEPRIPIDALPFTITGPGSYYLTQSFFYSGAPPAIEIASANVTLDLMGFSLLAASTGTAIAVGQHDDVSIRNGTIRGFGKGVADLAPAGPYGNRTRLQRLRLETNTVSIELLGAGHRIERCDVGAASGGVSLGNSAWISASEIRQVAAGAALVAGSMSWIEGNVIADNAEVGIDVSAAQSTTVSRNLLANNSGGGVHAGFGSLVQQNELANNAVFGIRIVGRSVVRGNAIRSATAIGIELFGTGSVVEENATLDGTAAIYFDSSLNFWANNRASFAPFTGMLPAGPLDGGGNVTF